MRHIVIILSLVFSLQINSQVCVDPSLIDPNGICIGLFDPVCGCDGNTYSNTCYAVTQGGVTSWVNGACDLNSACQQQIYIPGNIETAVYESQIQTASDGTVLPGKEVIMESEGEVALFDNFEATAGSEFLAEIKACNNASLSIGDSSNSANVTMGGGLVYESTLHVWKSLQTNLCPNTAVDLTIYINGTAVYMGIVEMADALGNNIPFLESFPMPPNGTFMIEAELIPTTIPGNANIFCLLLGDAIFGASF